MEKASWAMRIAWSSAPCFNGAQEWWQLAWHLIAKYGRLVTTYNESATQVEWGRSAWPSPLPTPKMSVK